MVTVEHILANTLNLHAQMLSDGEHILIAATAEVHDEEAVIRDALERIWQTGERVAWKRCFWSDKITLTE